MEKYMTEEERTMLPRILFEASKLDIFDQCRALGYLSCLTAQRKEKEVS